MLWYQPRSRRWGPGLKKFMWRGWQSHKKTSQRQNWRQKLGDNDEREHGFLENIFTKIPLLLGNCPKSHFPGNLELEGVGRMDTLHRSSPIRRVERPPGLRMVGLYPGSVQSQEASVSSLFLFHRFPLGWSRNSFRFFCKILWTNLDELFNQPTRDHSCLWCVPWLQAPSYPLLK